MAKKSGISLNPGADTTLVTAATRAALANVPKDLSGTFEALASNYATTMQSVANSWSEVTKKVGEVGRAAIGQAVVNLENRAMVAGISNKTNTTFLVDGLQEIKTSIYDTWRLRNEDGTANNPLSALNRSKRIDARQQRDKYFAQARAIKEGSLYLAENLAGNNVNLDATGVQNLTLANAVQALATSSGKSKDGTYVKPSHDEDKNIIFTLYGEDDKPITGFVNGKPVSVDGEDAVSVPAQGVNGLITLNNSDVPNGFDTLFSNLETSARKSKAGTKYSSFKPKLKNDARKLVDTEEKLHVGMHSNIYNFEYTFAEDMNNSEGSVTSAQIFGMMGNTLPKDSEGNELPVDEMADGKAGVTSADFTTGKAGVANYEMIRDAILDPSNKYYNHDVTEETFLQWIDNAGQSAFKFGDGQRVYKGPNEFDEGSGSSGIAWGNTYKPFSEQDTKIEDALAGRDLYDWENNRYITKDGGATYSPVEANALYSVGQSIPTNELLSGGQFGLSHRIGKNKFAGDGGGGDSGGIQIVNNKSKKYKGFGPKRGKQTVDSSSILSSLQSFNQDLKTVEDLQNFLGKVESDSNLKQKLIDHLNSQMNSNIDIDYVDDMIKDLIGNVKKKLK